MAKHNNILELIRTREDAAYIAKGDKGEAVEYVRLKIDARLKEHLEKNSTNLDKLDAIERAMLAVAVKDPLGKGDVAGPKFDQRLKLLQKLEGFEDKLVDGLYGYRTNKSVEGEFRFARPGLPPKKEHEKNEEVKKDIEQVIAETPKEQVGLDTAGQPISVATSEEKTEPTTSKLPPAPITVTIDVKKWEKRDVIHPALRESADGLGMFTKGTWERLKSSAALDNYEEQQERFEKLGFKFHHDPKDGTFIYRPNQKEKVLYRLDVPGLSDLAGDTADVAGDVVQGGLQAGVMSQRLWGAVAGAAAGAAIGTAIVPGIGTFIGGAAGGLGGLGASVGAGALLGGGGNYAQQKLAESIGIREEVNSQKVAEATAWGGAFGAAGHYVGKGARALVARSKGTPPTTTTPTPTTLPPKPPIQPIRVSERTWEHTYFETNPGYFWHQLENDGWKALRAATTSDQRKVNRIYFDVKDGAEQRALSSLLGKTADELKIPINFKFRDWSKPVPGELRAEATDVVANFASLDDAQRLFMALRGKPGYQAITPASAARHYGIRLDEKAEFASGYVEFRSGNMRYATGRREGDLWVYTDAHGKLRSFPASLLVREPFEDLDQAMRDMDSWRARLGRLPLDPAV